MNLYYRGSQSSGVS